MEDITRLTVHELVEKLNKNELSSEEIVKAYKARIEDKEKDVKEGKKVDLKKYSEYNKKDYSNKSIYVYAVYENGSRQFVEKFTHDSE